MKKRVATWIVAGVVLVGGGVALADTQPSDPAVDPAVEQPADTTTTTVVEGTTTTVAPEETTTTTEATTTTTEATTTTTEATPTTEADQPDDNESDDNESDAPEADHPDNHGATVSQAAHDHSHDAECGNHGKYVSAVAHGKDGCDTAAGTAASASGAEDGRHPGKGRR